MGDGVFNYLNTHIVDIRNIAIIAHVDHGKTTLTDAILRQTGAVNDDTSMDSNALEKERGITIYSKNAAAMYKGTKINIVDTPGHADFGSEVERVLRSIDSVLLVVDAQEGPMPQTRFVLKKSLALGLKPILVINKIDKPAADITGTHNEVFDLFAELGATDAQLDFPVVYAIGKNGVAMRHPSDEQKDMTPLLDMILEHVPLASGKAGEGFRAQPFNLAYDNFLGRMAIVRVHSGTANMNDKIFVKKPSGAISQHRITKLFTFEGTRRIEAEKVEAGDIAIIAGLPEVYIGDTLADTEGAKMLEAIAVDEPTIKLNFLVNNSPFAGREGTYVTSRQLRERLEKEIEVNVGLKVDFDSENTEQFIVQGRGELHIAILIENMKREGYELQVSQPQVILKEIDGQRSEPFEEVTVDVPENFQGAVIEKINKRGGIMTNMHAHASRVMMTFEAPSRGLLSYRNTFVIDTKGEGIFASRVIGYKPHVGEISRATTGSMISGQTGKALGYALDNLQTRGTLYIGPTTEVYEGMVIGNTSKDEQMTVNPIKGKKLSNMRSKASDEAIILTPPKLLTIEIGLEVMARDEYLEVTPKSVRLRKKYLTENERNKTRRRTE